jgi:hypothetical protein
VGYDATDVRTTRNWQTQMFTHAPLIDYVVTFRIVNYHEMKVNMEITPYGTNMKLILDGKKIKPSRSDKRGGGFAYDWSFKIDGTNCSFSAGANYGPGYGAPIIRDTSYRLVRLYVNGKVCWEYFE